MVQSKTTATTRNRIIHYYDLLGSTIIWIFARSAVRSSPSGREKNKNQKSLIFFHIAVIDFSCVCGLLSCLNHIELKTIFFF